MGFYFGKTALITGSTRGIGLEIAKKLASYGANIIITGKTEIPHPKLPGTIHSAAEEVITAGGNAFARVMDIRDEDQVRSVIEEGVAHFGGLDILVNNASAIQLTDTLSTDMKRFDLMHQINTRGTFLASKHCIPHLLKSANPHILTLSPPLQMDDKWFGMHLPYTLAKYGMSLVVRGLSNEFASKGIAINALWPRTTIATAAVQNLLGGDKMIEMSRIPAIMADAANLIFQKDSKGFTGNFLIDEEVLFEAGIVDLSHYAVNPDADLMPDIFL